MTANIINHYDGLSGKLVFSAPQALFEQCHHQGRCDEDVAHWNTSGHIRWFTSRAEWIAMLKETGAWALADLNEEDDDTLKERIIWLAAGDWQEDQK